MVLGTNAIAAFGMQVLHSNGEVVHPSPTACKESGERVQLGGETHESTEKTESTGCTSEGDAQANSKDTGKVQQVTRVILSQVVHLGPRQTKEVKVEMRQLAEMDTSAEMLGIVAPDKECLAEHKCDFVETL